MTPDLTVLLVVLALALGTIPVKRRASAMSRPLEGLWGVGYDSA